MRSSTNSRWFSRTVAMGATALISLTAACSSSGSSTNGSSANAATASVTVALPVDVSTLDPSAQYSANATGLYSNIFDSLTNISPGGKVVPDLATDWKSEDGAKTWDFTLRKNVKFSNGEPVTAEDVVFSFVNILTSKDSPLRSPLKVLKSVKAISADKVQFVLTSSRADFPGVLSLIWVVPEKVYTNDKTAFARKPVGSGPYVVKSWKPDDRMELEANSNYWGAKPNVTKAVFQIVPSAASAVAAILSGDVDLVPSLPPEQVDTVSKDSNITVEKYETNRVVYFGINLKNPALSDVKLRKAIDMAIDRDALVKLVHGAGVPVGQPVAKATFGYDPSIAPTKYDPALAKSLVSESTYHGQIIQFDYPSDRFASVSDVVQLIGSQLEAVGIKVKLSPMPYTVFLPKWFDAQKQLPGLYLSTYGPSGLDAAIPIEEFFTNPTRTAFSNADVLALQKKELSVPDEALRQEYMSKIFPLAAQDVPYVWLYTQVETGGVRNRVEWTPRADSQLRFAEIKLK